MRGAHAGTDTPLLGGLKWMPWGPPFVIHKAGRRKHSIGIQAQWGLMTVTKQPGKIVGGYLKPSHI